MKVKIAPAVLSISAGILVYGYLSKDTIQPQEIPKQTIQQTVKSDCSTLFYKSVQPSYKTTLQQDIPICYSEYFAMYSVPKVGTIYVAEKLNSESLKDADSVVRDDAFHEEPAIKAFAHPKLESYKGSTYDRGHLAPAADFSSKKSQYEGFSLVNIVPQNSSLNRGKWASLEDEVRQYARVDGTYTYIVTGVTYSNVRLGSISVPDIMYKAVYRDDGKVYGAYIADNKTGIVKQTTISKLNEIVGYDVFPKLNLLYKTTETLK